jgi:hypothetical protein
MKLNHINDVVLEGHVAAIMTHDRDTVIALNVRKYEVSSDGSEYARYRRFAVKYDGFVQAGEKDLIRLQGRLDHNEDGDMFVQATHITILQEAP